MQRRPWMLSEIECALAREGDLMCLTLPKGTVTAIEQPESGVQDGIADYLRSLGREHASIRRVVLTRDQAVFGLGAISNGAVRAFVHEVSRQYASSPESLLPLLTGKRDALLPMGPLVDRLANCQVLAEKSAVLPEGWLGGTMPFMTPLGLMAVGALSVGTLEPGTNRVIYLMTTARVAPTVLRVIAQRLSKPFFAWLEALGLRTSADALVLSATGTSRSINIQSADDPQALMLQTALSVWVDKTIVAWGEKRGLNARVRLEGAVDEEELTRVVRSVTAAGRWLAEIQSVDQWRGVILEAVRCAALVNDVEGDRWMALGDEQITRQTQANASLEAFKNGELRFTLHLGRGPFSTTFVV